MKNLDCNQIMIFINLEIIGKKFISIFLKSNNISAIIPIF